MISVNLAAFAEAYDNETLRGAPRALTGRLVGNEVRPYPKREAINPAADQAFAYAHPVDVYNLQIQGSGRIAFPDGEEVRAAYAAQNGYRWNSALARCAIAANCRARPGPISAHGRSERRGRHARGAQRRSLYVFSRKSRSMIPPPARAAPGGSR